MSNCLWCAQAQSHARMRLCICASNHPKNRNVWAQIPNTKGFIQWAYMYMYYSPQMFRHKRLHTRVRMHGLRSPVCWFSINGAPVRKHASTQDTSCHVFIQLLWNPKYPCLFVLVELHIHHNYVIYNPYSAFYKQLHCELEAFWGQKGSG